MTCARLARVLIRSQTMEAKREQHDLKSHRNILSIHGFGQCVYITIACCLTLILLILPCSGDFTFSGNGTAFKTCDNIGTFKFIFSTSLSGCIEECFRRQRCGIIMFHYGMTLCALKDYLDITDLGEQVPLCLYHTLNTSTLESYHQHPCFNHTCGTNEKCTDIPSGGFSCAKSECPAPDTIANAELSSYTHDIGTRNSYNCKSGYYGIGTPTITCDSNATWTSSRFGCLSSTLTCPLTNLHYFNSDLTYVVVNESPDETVLHFTCRDGYKSTGETVTSTCLDGQWTPKVVVCCHVNSTHFWYSDCYKPIDAGKISSDSAAEAFCESIGGYWRWFNWVMRDVLLSNTNIYYVLQAVYKDWINENWNYTACAEANGEIGDAFQSFDDKAHEVMSKAWTGNVCWWGRCWAPSGEPNGGDSDNCIAIPLVITENVYYQFDIPCDPVPLQIGFVCGFGLPTIR